MKKILLSAYACSPIRGSEENNGWSWAISLAQKGYEVWCVTNCQDKNEKEEERKKLGIENLHFIFIGLPNWLEKALFDPSSKSIYLHYFLWRRMASKKVVAYHKKYNFDVAHHVSYGSFQQGSCLYNLEDCNIIFGPVGGGQMSLPIFKPYYGKAWKTEVIRGYISKLLVNYSSSLRKTIRKANTILTVNKETLSLLKGTGLFKGQSEMILDAALPVKYEQFSYAEKSDTGVFKILWIGRLLPRKGIQLSLKALSYLPKNFEYKLSIVGGGSDEKNIDKWIEDFGLDKAKIDCKGKIPYEDVSKEYQKSDALLFCSMRDTSGNQVIEAMAHSLPVIVFNISGMVTMVPDTCGIKVTPSTTEGTAKDIAKAIEELKVNVAFRKKAGKAAFEHAMQLTMKQKVDYISAKYY